MFDSSGCRSHTEPGQPAGSCLHTCSRKGVGSFKGCWGCSSWQIMARYMCVKWLFFCYLFGLSLISIDVIGCI